MESGMDRLNSARRELVASSEWFELSKELQLLLNDIHGPFDLNSASMTEVCSNVKKTGAYRELQIKVSNCLARYFTPGVQESTPVWYQKRTLTDMRDSIPLGSHTKDYVHNDQTTAEMNRRISVACSHLLRSNPRLKHFMKNCLNHPLGNDLRKTAWSMLLQSRVHTPTDKRVIRQDLEKVQSLKSDWREVEHKLDRILASARTLLCVAKSSLAVKAIKTVTLYWKQQNGGDLIRDRDLFLCIPFASVWSEVLERGAHHWELVAGERRKMGEAATVEMAEVFINFMKILPVTMSDIETEVGNKAMNQFCQQVEELLRLSDHKLYKYLAKILSSKSSKKKASPQRKQHGQYSTFHEGLATVLHQHVQRLLVGDLPLDVVCFIWDQCFIGRTVPHFQCLHYYITTWLILLRDKLLTCPNVQSICDVLKSKSEQLTIQQFQIKIERTFLRQLSSELGIMPIFLPCSLSRHRSTKLPSAGPSLSSHHSLHSPSKHTLFHQRPSTDQLANAAALRLDREKEHLKQEIEVLRRKLEEQYKVLAEKTEKERVLRKKEVKALQQEIYLLKNREKDICYYPTQWPPSLTATPQSVRQSPWMQTNSSTCIPTPSLSHLTSAEAISSIQNNTESSSVSTQSTKLCRSTKYPTSSSTNAVSLQFSSNSTLTLQLSVEEAQEIWLKIFARFSNGLYLLCHGEGIEKSALLHVLAKHVFSDSKDELQDIQSIN